mmetsp:Transcript_6676/g.13629  ORF Transcript_6676/g.13629 Transcript_6676/m.13629 type:complete len:92 (-) Transcript_6676:238-513(-)
MHAWEVMEQARQGNGLLTGIHLLVSRTNLVLSPTLGIFYTTANKNAVILWCHGMMHVSHIKYYQEILGISRFYPAIGHLSKFCTLSDYAVL